MVSFPGMITAVFKTLVLLNIIDSVLSESEVEDCTRYIENLYNNETDPLTIFQIGFLSLNDKVIEQINEQFGTETEFTTDLGELDMIIKKMNKYTKKYFHQVLHDIKITGKQSLLNTKDFCEEHFKEDVTCPTIPFEHRVILCSDMIYSSFGIYETGAEAFDYVYNTYTEDDISKVSSFTGDLYYKNLNYDVLKRSVPTLPAKELIISIFYETIFSYYYHFKCILNNADVRGFTTPERFCEEEIYGLVYKDCKEEFGEPSNP